MNLLALRTNLHHPAREDVPFCVYTVGTEQQSAITRMKGFSANQLFLTFSGSGIFRPLGQDKWDTIESNTMLYIPAGLPHEYVPQSPNPWMVGYVTFVEKRSGMLESWGFGTVPYKLRLGDMSRLIELLEGIWSNSGPHYDTWRSAEQLFSFCAEVKKQATPHELQYADNAAKGTRYRDSVDSAVRFLHDHMHRDLSMAELASHVGYSPKHLNRLFRRDIGMTPMTYLQRVRLKTAALLLAENPGMTVRQAAAHIGMEPVYFTRLFRRAYGATPSEFKKKQPGG